MWVTSAENSVLYYVHCVSVQKSNLGNINMYIFKYFTLSFGKKKKENSLKFILNSFENTEKQNIMS